MIKYGVLEEYRCANCGEIVITPQHEELSKLGSVGTCKHSWELVNLKKEDVQKESPEE